MKEGRKISPGEVTDNLVEALHQAATENDETLNDELRRSGYDLREVRQRGQAFIETLKGRVRLAQAQQRQERLLSILSRAKSSLPSISNPEHQIREWISEEFGNEISKPALQAFYHKLKKIDEEDIESLVQDAELLRIWEDMGNKGNDGEQS